MTKNLLKLNVLLFFSFVSLFYVGSPILAQQNPKDKAISNAVYKFEKAWNNHDAKAFSMVFAEDADFTNVFGQNSKGRTSIEGFHAPMFAGMFKASQLKITGIAIRMIRKDVAAVDVTWNMSGAMDPEGKPWPDRQGLINLIMTPKGKEWLITVMHNMDLLKN